MREAQVDLYGSFADASCMADYLELLALTSGSLTQDELADAIDDADLEHWSVRPTDWIIDENQTRDEKLEETEAGDASQRVFDLLDERASILGDRYPFRLIRGRLEYVSGTDPSGSPYCAFLAIATVHAHQLSHWNDAPRVFEDSVAGVMSDAGFATVNFGRQRRAAPDFDTAVLQAAGSIGLAPTPTATERSVMAQDGSVDVISHLDFIDGRKPTWCLIGQATCARSNDWKYKLAEPPRKAWAAYLNVEIMPSVYLAIPHHIEPPHLRVLMQSTEHAMVLDRLRLCIRKAGVSADEERLIQMVLDEDWESPID
jgi:hypothetical protein